MTGPASGSLLVPRLRDQLENWATRLRACLDDGSPPIVAHSPDRAMAAHVLAKACRSRPLPLGRMKGCARIGQHLIVITSAGAPGAADPPPQILDDLHSLLRYGVVIWGLTGRRPNAVSAYCHDTMALADQDPVELSRIHHVVVNSLSDAMATHVSRRHGDSEPRKPSEAPRHAM